MPSPQFLCDMSKGGGINIYVTSLVAAAALGRPWFGLKVASG